MIINYEIPEDDITKMINVEENEFTDKMFYILVERPGITGQKLSSYLNIDKSTVHWHIKEISRDGLITIKKDGKYRRYYSQIESMTM